MNSEFWNQKFDRAEYVYGQKPNEYYRSRLDKLVPGKALFVAEGEGRNALYAASKGWEVTAIDISEKARQKALDLFKLNELEINYILSGIESFDFRENYFDLVVAVFIHFPEDRRQLNHRKMISLIKPGGHLILQGFAKEQLSYNSGGPKSHQMLFSTEELKEDFQGLADLEIDKYVDELDEGALHQGRAELIGLHGTKI